MSKTEDRELQAAKRIVSMIEVYGKSKFAIGMIRYYGLRSLLDRGELDNLQECINEVA